MNRTIKFRGKSIFSGEWLYGCLVNMEHNRFSILPEINKMPRCKCIADYEIHNTTIGQFTGMKDKNGKEIYEGDILRTSISKNGIGFVRWNIENASFVVQMKNSAQWYNLWRGYEVIGSIHDNPELLKGGQNEQTAE